MLHGFLAAKVNGFLPDLIDVGIFKMLKIKNLYIRGRKIFAAQYIG
jgi:hypothetical protein